MSNVVDQSRWDDSYLHYQFHSQENALLTHEICRTLQAIGAVPRGRCFEVGCYPCGFLAALGKTYDLEINGVDITSVPFSRCMPGWIAKTCAAVRSCVETPLPS